MGALESAYRGYHWGNAPGRVLSVDGPDDVPAHTRDCGRLVRLELEDGRVLRAPDGVRIATDAAGRRVWLVAPGGGVRLPPGFLAGRIHTIVYRAAKAGRTVHTYWHPFEGTRPRIVRDRAGLARIERAGSRFRVTYRGFEG